MGGVLLAAGGTAAALGVLSGQPSGPPTGKLGGSTVDSGAATGYIVSVTPNLDGGAVGWCMTDHVFFKGGSSSGLGCDGAPLPGRPIIASDVGSSSSTNRSGVTATTTNLVFLTTPQVAAVRISPTLTILTRADPQLPNHYRIAIDIQQTITHGRTHPKLAHQPAVALDRAGQRIGLLTPPLSIPPHDAATYWQPGPTIGVRPQPTLHKPPAGACEIDTSALHGSDLVFGSVVQHVHGFPNLASKTYLSCATTQFSYDHKNVIAAILLDAQHPGSTPEPLPNATPVPQHPLTFNEPDAVTPADTRAPFPAGPITARRVGNAWLIVQTNGTLAQRLAILDRLAACTRLSGRSCPAPG
jgi:hypothetical protein